MKKIILVFFAFYSFSYSQTGWQLQTNSLTRNIVSIYVLQNGYGYSLGDNGIIFRTTNFGINWVQYSQFPALSDNSAYCITAVNNDTLVATQGSEILRSVNGGLNWSYVSSGGVMTYTYFYSVSFGNKRRGFACGVELIPPPPPPPPLPYTANTIVHCTSDGGTNWTRISVTSGDVLYSCKMSDSLTGYTAGTNYYSTNYGSVFKTTNGGLYFSSISSGVSAVNSIYFINNFTGWAGGNSGFIANTTTGSAPWIPQVSHSAVKINSIYFVNSMTGWIAGNNGTIRKTVNGGANWNFQYCPVGDNLNSICFTDSIHGWIGSNNGKILYTDDAGGLTNLNKVSEDLPDSYLLSQNYPNPFNPSTKIKYRIKNDNFVSIKIFDALGKEIITLVNKTQKPGIYEITFEGSEYPNGIYYCRLTAGIFSETIKMIFLK
jgi:photosystem II stability/assembly factor-like uncharacterized protein